MNGIFLLSVILKGIGAVLEVLLQILITRSIGVDGFGTYSTWINTADIIFWVLFSALTKCNTFYLSVPNTSISNFKKKYYGRYVLPILIGLFFVMIFVGKTNLYCSAYYFIRVKRFRPEQYAVGTESPDDFINR